MNCKYLNVLCVTDAYSEQFEYAQIHGTCTGGDITHTASRNDILYALLAQGSTQLAVDRIYAQWTWQNLVLSYFFNPQLTYLTLRLDGLESILIFALSSRLLVLNFYERTNFL